MHRIIMLDKEKVPILTIVVPVYKVEKYINRCVESLVSQTLKNLQIILVDDGSPDSCPEMCDQWAERDSRIIVIHKSNGGLSSARNAGLKIAAGKYIGFVDSDDDVECDMYEKMIAKAEEHKVDFVMSDYHRISMDGEDCIKTLPIDSGYYDREKIRSVIFPELIMKEIIDYGPLLSVWHCLYRVDFLRKNGLKFDEQVRWSEDNIFSAIMGYCARSFYYLKGEALYHYYQNPGTITTSYRKGAWEIYCKMNEHLHDFFDGVHDYDFSRQLKLHLIYYACNCISMELRQEHAIKAIDKILWDSRLIASFHDFDLPQVPITLKIQLILMKYKQSRLLYALKK